MEDNITAPFPAGPWKFETRRAGGLAKPAAVLLVSTSTDVAMNDRVIFALREDWLDSNSDEREHARALIESAPDLFRELAGSVNDLQDLAVKLREAGSTAHAEEIECRIVSIRETLARATTIDRLAALKRYVVGIRASGINVTAETLETARQSARWDAQEFTGRWNWELSSGAEDAPYLDLSSIEQVAVLSGFTLECTCQKEHDYTFNLHMDVVVEAGSPELANAAALALTAAVKSSKSS